MRRMQRDVRPLSEDWSRHLPSVSPRSAPLMTPRAQFARLDAGHRRESRGDQRASARILEIVRIAAHPTSALGAACAHALPCLKENTAGSSQQLGGESGGGEFKKKKSENKGGKSEDPPRVRSLLSPPP